MVMPPHPIGFIRGRSPNIRGEHLIKRDLIRKVCFTFNPKSLSRTSPPYIRLCQDWAWWMPIPPEPAKPRTLSTMDCHMELRLFVRNCTLIVHTNSPIWIDRMGIVVIPTIPWKPESISIEAHHWGSSSMRATYMLEGVEMLVEGGHQTAPELVGE